MLRGELHEGGGGERALQSVHLASLAEPEGGGVGADGVGGGYSGSLLGIHLGDGDVRGVVLERVAEGDEVGGEERARTAPGGAEGDHLGAAFHEHALGLLRVPELERRGRDAARGDGSAPDGADASDRVRAGDGARTRANVERAGGEDARRRHRRRVRAKPEARPRSRRAALCVSARKRAAIGSKSSAASASSERATWRAGFTPRLVSPASSIATHRDARVGGHACPRRVPRVFRAALRAPTPLRRLARARRRPRRLDLVRARRGVLPFR